MGWARGFTLLELTVALVLTSVVAGAVSRLLLTHQRVYGRHAARVELQSNVRAAVTVFPRELTELNASDTADSDIVVLGDTLIGYKAMRGLFFLCQPPVSVGASGTVVLWESPSFGIRDLDPARDSMFVFAEADTTTSDDDFWIHASVRDVASTAACPGGARGTAVELSGVHPAGGLALVWPGAPARGVETVQVAPYRDVYSDWWMGLRQFNKLSGWSRIQPFAGPVDPGGVRFYYYDRDGQPTTDRRNVARIEVLVIGRSSRMVWGGGGVAFLRDTMTVGAALWNNRRSVLGS